MKKIKLPSGVEDRKWFKPWISVDDKNAVNKTLNQTMLTLGPQLEKFESNFSKYTKSKYAVAVSNCTAALHLSNQCQNVQLVPMTILTAACNNAVHEVKYARK